MKVPITHWDLAAFPRIRVAVPYVECGDALAGHMAGRSQRASGWNTAS